MDNQAQIFLESYYSFDKGKPVEKRRRKVKGLKLCTTNSYDSLAAEGETNIRWIDLSAFIA